MELHSYAKRRASKKWTIEQKRKLVEARINYDSWFNSKPSNSVVPWKKVLSVAKLDDFNVFFVRKQWSNMLTRYKQYKQTRLDGIATNKAIHAEMIERINQEWEFFEAIHAFMTRKTTNLHSYAVTQKFSSTSSSTSGGNEVVLSFANIGHVMEPPHGGEVVAGAVQQTLSRTHHEQQKDIKPTSTMLKEGSSSSSSASLMKLQHDCVAVKENIPNNTTILLQVAGSDPRAIEASGVGGAMPIFSSDTNEEFEMVGSAGTIVEASSKDYKDIIKNCGRNTDHDFYSKRSVVAIGSAGIVRKFPIEERQLHYFLDTSEESLGTEYVQNTSSLESSSLPSVMENIELHTENARTFEIKADNISQSHNASNFVIKQENFSMTELPSTSTERMNNITNNTTTQRQNPTSTSSGNSRKISEREKYYRHKRRFNRRLEKRFDALLHVVGQVVKAEYPSVDVKPLMDTVATVGCELNHILSSDSEEEESDDDDDKDQAAETRRPPTSSSK
uniref:MADF domain-containing protein n=1 Tax=Stomoxys calcitrans TaxID=35570 RepID=A0A1I8PRT0_STOCA